MRQHEVLLAVLLELLEAAHLHLELLRLVHDLLLDVVGLLLDVLEDPDELWDLDRRPRDLVSAAAPAAQADDVLKELPDRGKELALERMVQRGVALLDQRVQPELRRGHAALELIAEGVIGPRGGAHDP